MDSAKNQLVEKLQSATNILVTVSRDPSVDQLAACVGLTLLLNKFGKHATAVFSGEVPSTLEFLQPEQTLEKNTDSLRDFIIALDKSKADKLRYKVEDEMVRIFITPFRVSLTAADLEFSQGDFNVDVVLALGVSRQEDFDAAIIAHGRILHDAVVSSISTTSGSQLGSINWSEPNASSLSEVIVALAHALGDNLLDAQVATALLTGIVAETARFSNEKTTPQTMTLSAELMAAGANQQLVATKLQEPLRPQPVLDLKPLAESELTDHADGTVTNPAITSADGTLEIDHDSIEAVLQDLQANDEPELDDATSRADEPIATELPAPSAEDAETIEPAEADSAVPSNKQSRLIIEPPTLGGTLTANSQPESLDPPNDILGLSTELVPTLLNRPSPTPKPAAPRIEPLLTGFTPPPPAWIAATQDAGNQLDDPNNLLPPTIPTVPTTQIDSAKTLSEIENDVHEAKTGDEQTGQHLDDVRDEIERALNSQPAPPQAVQALGAQPLGEPLHPVETVAPLAAPGLAFADVLQQVIPAAPAGTTLAAPVVEPVLAAQPIVIDPNAPPPVPPPIPFNFGAAQQ